MKYAHKQFLIPFLQITVASLLGLGLLTSCGGSGGGGSSAPPPQIAAISSINGITSFNQTVAATDGHGESAPGQANRWIIDGDFSILDAGDDQFDGALGFSISDGISTNSFPFDQAESELSFFTPELGAANGVITASNFGTFAVLHGTHDSRLQQTINLDSALTGITLTWSGGSSANSGGFGSSIYYYRVVLRDTNGTVLTTLYENNGGAVTGTFGTSAVVFITTA